METTNLLARLRDAVGEVIELDRTMDLNGLVLKRDSEGFNTLTLILCALEDTSDGTGAAKASEIFMEVARKETTLTDVDNALAGVLRRYGDQL